VGNSVAGQIRIDLLTNVARFKTDMREAGREGLGGFTQEFQKTQRAISQKSLAADIQGRKDAWQSAMRSLRGDIQQNSGFDQRGNSRDMLSWYALENSNPSSGDPAYQRMSRLKGYLPSSQSTWTTLSAQEAAFAASQGSMTGGKGGSSGFGSTVRGLGRLALGRGPMGQFASMGLAVDDFSLATKGVGLFGAGLMVAHGFAANLGREIKQTREDAIGLGMTYDQLAQKRGQTEHSRFVEGGAMSATASGEGAKSLGASIWGGVVAISAMQDEAISEAWRRKSEGGMGVIKGLYSGGKRGLGSVSAMAKIARQDDASTIFVNNLVKNKGLTEAQALAADEAARYKDNLTAALRPMESLRDTLRDMEHGPGTTARDRFIEGLKGATFKDRLAAVREYDAAEQQIYLKGEENRKKDEDRQRRKDESKQRDQDREQRKQDRESMREQFKTPGERYGDELGRAADLFGKGSGEYGRIEKSLRDQERSRLGVRDPLGDYERDLKERRSAVKAGTMSEDEYGDWQKRRRREAVGELSGEEPSVKPAAAMARGSAAAYSTIVNSQMNDPKVALAREANAKLARIEAAIVRQGVGQQLDF
jgi:hypothetical protein